MLVKTKAYKLNLLECVFYLHALEERNKWGKHDPAMCLILKLSKCHIHDWHLFLVVIIRQYHQGNLDIIKA
jgi:hypothetical protein